MNKNIISLSNNQAFIKDNLSVAYWLGGSTPAMFVPEHLSNKIFTESRRKMTEEVLRHINANDVAFPSHTTIAKAAGLKRQAAFEYLKWAEEIGIFKVIHRAKQWDSNIYFLGDVLKDCRVRWSLRNVFNGLHKAFSKTVDVLNKAAKIAKRTLLLNNNVFKRNTNQGDYKEVKLHASPYIKNSNLYQNMKKALWSDWSVDEDRYRAGVKMIDDKLLKQEVNVVHSHNTGKISPNVMQERLVLCSAETNLNRRLAMFERLRSQVERASVPYIERLINKTHDKLSGDFK